MENKEQKSKNKKGVIRTLVKSVDEYKKQTLAAPILVIFEVLLEVIIPVLMALIVDVGVNGAGNEFVFSINFGSVKWDLFTMHDRVQFIVVVGLSMAVMAMISLVFGVLAGKYAAIAGIGFGKNLRRDMYYKVQDLSFANIDKYNTAGLVTRLTNDVTNVQQSYMMVIRILVRAPIMLILAIIMAASINPELSLVFVAVVPLLAGALAVFGAFAFPSFNKLLEKYDEMNESTQENLAGIRVVKAFVRGDYEIKRFKVLSEKFQKIHLRVENIMTFAMPIMQFFMYACMIAIAWFGGIKLIFGEMELGSFMAFMAYLLQILNSLMLLAFVFVLVVLSKASALRIAELLNEEVDIKDDEKASDTPVADGSIDFSNVTFSYNKNPENLHLLCTDLKIKSGEKIGIIGGTGSSKSTLVQLIPRLYDVTGGEIKVGGKDVREYKLKTLRDSVAMVLQKNVLFTGTIKDNLKWGDENATDDEIIQAAKAAHAHDFITSFKDGYDTILGQGGVNLSGGQKQRLCIARALLKKPKIIILDDSTSAVDTATDAKIRQEFKENLKDLTVLIIAQRVTSVMDADRIIVMDEGKISAVGTHEELLKTSEIYADVYNLQLKGVGQ
jgi:ATP-binding cassette subfamily B multidrug efflux pump